MATLDKTIQVLMLKGEGGTISVGSVTTVGPGSNAAVVNSDTTGDAVLDFTIPRGDKGETGTISIGTVATGEPGSNAAVANIGTKTDAVFDFTIPRGDKGEKGDKGEPGSTYGGTWRLITGTITNQTDLIERTRFPEYTEVTQLGLSFPCATIDILNAMPDNSKATIAFNDTASSLTDAPINHGILTILKLNSARRQIIITQ